MGRKHWFIEYYQNFFIAVFAGIVVAIATPVAESNCKLGNILCFPLYLKFLGYIILLFFVGMVIVYFSNNLLLKKYGKKCRPMLLSKWWLIILLVFILILFLFNLKLGLWVTFGLILVYILHASTINLNKKSLGGLIKWGLPIILSLIIVGFISNQIVSPLVSPRVSNIKITPLYIQGMESETAKQDINYYILFDVEYEIEMPLFLLYETLDLRMPGEQTHQNIDLITSFQENNPYYEINLDKELLEKGSFLPYDKINGKIPLIIKADSMEIKKINAHFIIREKNDLHQISFNKKGHYWWTDATISPIKSSGNVVTEPYFSLIGYGLNEHGHYYGFYDIVIESLTDLEIKGLTIVARDKLTYCDEGVELYKLYEHISIDLRPKEIKHILAVFEVPETTKITNKDFVFDFTSKTECYGQWLKYKELIGEK